MGTIIFSLVFFRKPAIPDRESIQELLREKDKISDREAEVAWLPASGLSAKEIGEKLYISVKTV